ncbi:DNA-formamidopyrimidine glycosylase family protein [Curtobacterium sp. MCPF17_050]|uniref:DNA-formamidopyrimidine glycosylase family protein n=1 Tax=Curtobacterium sp. MCPF17_050 TaxID=2175664 RepID=UPI000D99A402|nr:DNA-formamidopyrimidine glycosylase family protein [Curtobacterium sp. MCPF17_050]WIB16190.1 DNA-formamidopyrimidine glycosylase family protein [Curtobacterium sp. MCPF17_050]
MPEGDSVHRLAARLRQVDGARVVSGELRGGGAAGRRLAGRRVLAHATHGKHLLTRFDDGTTLHTHMRMQGSWTVTSPGRRLPPTVAQRARVRLGLEDGRVVWGIDLPVVDLVDTVDEHAVVGHLGPDLLHEDFDAAEAVRRLTAEPDATVRSVLLDQRRVAGLGNLWVNELGFVRGLHPDRPVGDVDAEALVATARRMLHHSATVPEAYQVTTGLLRRGERHWVVGRAGRRCLRCGTTVTARDDVEVVGSPARRLWWCPRCQPPPSPSDRRPADP